MSRNKKMYAVSVEIETKVNKTGKPSPGYDQINVGTGKARMNQTLLGAGPGNQTDAAATDKDRPRRIAHEYGHTLGLPDGYEDTRPRYKSATQSGQIFHLGGAEFRRTKTRKGMMWVPQRLYSLVYS